MVTIIPSRRERKKEETRARLLSTAIKLMNERGFDALTVEAIADAADVGKGTIYNYFETKEDIVVAFFVDLERRVQNKVARLTDKHDSLDQVLISFLQHQFRLKRPHLQFVRIFFAQMFTRPEQMYPYIVDLQTIIDPPLVHLFESLQKRQLLRRDAPIELIVLNFKTMHFGLSAMWALEGPPWHGTSKALPSQVSLFCSGLETIR
jgi:AcrR family transcriptional regulator